MIDPLEPQPPHDPADDLKEESGWEDPVWPLTEAQYKEVTERLHEVEDDNDQLRESLPHLTKAVDGICKIVVEVLEASEQLRECEAMKGTTGQWPVEREKGAAKRWNDAWFSMEGIRMGMGIYNRTGPLKREEGKTFIETLSASLVDALPAIQKESIKLAMDKLGMPPKRPDEPGHN